MSDIDKHVINWFRQVHSGSVSNRVRLQAGWPTEWKVWRTSESDWSPRNWHAPRWHVCTRNRCTGISRAGNHHRVGDASSTTNVTGWADWHWWNHFSPFSVNSIGDLFDIASIAGGEWWATSLSLHFEIHVTDSDNGHDRPPLVGFLDWIDTGIKSCRNERFNVGNCQFLKPCIRQVNHFRDEVIAFDLIQVLIRQLNGDAVVRQVSIGVRVCWIHLQCRVENQPFTARNPAEFQAIGRGLHEIVTARCDELMLGIAGRNLPANVHPIWSDKPNLCTGRSEGSGTAGTHSPTTHTARTHHRQYAGPWAVNHRAWPHHHCGWRCMVFPLVSAGVV